MAQIPTYDPNWQERIRGDDPHGADKAVAEIPPGKRVFVGTGCAQPTELVKALTARAAKLPDTEIVHLLTTGEAPYAEKKLASSFRINSFFIAENVRDIIQEGLGDYTPIFLSDIPKLFSSGQLPLDVALIQVTPPDERGMCSLGVSVDIVKSAAEERPRWSSRRSTPACRAPWAIRASRSMIWTFSCRLTCRSSRSARPSPTRRPGESANTSPR